LADKSTRLIVEALSRAAVEPAGLPLFGAKSAPGLFPTSAAARLAAQRCKDEGYLTAGANGSREVGTITEKGRAWLIHHTSPRQVLEDFVRVLEERRHQAAELIAAAQHIVSSVESLKNTVELLHPQEAHHLTAEDHGDKPRGSLCEDIPVLLEQWHAAASGDCPLPELFRRLCESHPTLTIGCFHDQLRALKERRLIYLHPWTGPLYDLPEPPFALMSGHEIAYYASARTGNG
jgi:hypothetical protein